MGWATTYIAKLKLTNESSMSYDLMVFDVAAAPKGHSTFMAWYDQQSEWEEDHSYDDPAVSTPALRAWFLEMIRFFPPLNGPFRPGTQRPALTFSRQGSSGRHRSLASDQR